jgi:sulfite exporter TauE/SafE
MEQYLIAFITGLTTGGLSCLAVQGGLLASSLARQLEQDLHRHPPGSRSKLRPPQTALPIFLFLTSKVVAYTLLGFLLGALGSVLTLSTTFRALLLIAIGVFMLGNALRMFNVHPIFRYFVIEPPKFITRYIRRTAKNDADLATPIFLGALTVLIPCGVTQAMMAVALATGSPMQGAGLMLAFTLGTSPVFFGVAYLATQIGAKLEAMFMRFVASMVFFLGIVSILTGMTLAGMPIPVAGWMKNLFVPQLASQPNGAAAVFEQPASAVLNLAAQNNGYFPETLVAAANVPVQVNIITDKTTSCSRAFVIPDLGVETILPVTGSVPIEIPPQAPGTVMGFTCSMGMYSGQIVFR